MGSFEGMWTYILYCEGPSYYVGKTEHLHTRIKRHFAGTGAQWTRSHPPLSIVMLFQGDCEKDTYHDLREELGPIVFGAGNTRGVLR